MTQRCANLSCKYDNCIKPILYGDIVVCWNCYIRIPVKLRTKAIDTGKNQGLEALQ